MAGRPAIALRLGLALLAVLGVTGMLVVRSRSDSAPVSETVKTSARPLVAPAEVSSKIDPFVAQVKMLSTALRQLRQLKDPRLALRTLEPYISRFPNGPLLFEVRAVQAEAQLQLGDSHNALATVESLEGVQLPRRALRPHQAKLRVLRGEALAQEGRCVDALAVFGTAAPREAKLAQRALWGTAQCQREAGRTAASRATLRTLVTRYPEGDFAARAREQLGE